MTKFQVGVFFCHAQAGCYIRTWEDLNYVNNVTPFEQLQTRENQWHKKVIMWLKWDSASDWRASGIVCVLSCIRNREEGNNLFIVLETKEVGLIFTSKD